MPRWLVVLFFLMAPMGAAHACSCAWGRTADALGHADAVFLGRPVSFRPSLLNPRGAEVARFAVERVWKGDVGVEVGVVGWFDNSCGLTFLDDGRAWIVFASRDRWGRLTTHGCSGTTAAEREAAVRAVADSSLGPWIDPGREMLAELGPGRPPSGPPEPDPWPAVVGWGAVSALVLAGWAVARRR